MKELIQNICSIQYAPLSKVESETIDRLGQTIDLSITDGWQDLPVAAGGSLSIGVVTEDRGRAFASALTFTLRQSLLIDEPVILRVELTDDQLLIIGERDFPVMDISETHLLAGKTISIQYESWHYPFTPL